MQRYKSEEYHQYSLQFKVELVDVVELDDVVELVDVV
jgi:hypothetical protein